MRFYDDNEFWLCDWLIDWLFYHQRGSKGDGLSSLVKVEYGSSTLGESAKVDSTNDVAAEYNFNAKFDWSFDDPIVLDEIAFKPVLGQ